MKRVIKKYALNILWIILFAIIAIYFSLRGEYQDIMAVLGGIDVFWLIVIILLAIVPYLFDGLILTIFARIYKKTYRLKQGIVNALSGGFFNGITPFASGGQFAQVYIFKKQGVETTSGIGILLMNFIVYQIAMVFYTLLILIFKFNKFYTEFSSFVSLALIGFAINAVVIFGLLFGAISHRFQRFLTGTVLLIGHKLHIVKNYEVSKVNLDQKILDFRRELGIMSKHKGTIAVIFVLFLIRLTILYSIPFFTMLSLGRSLPFSEYFDYVGISAFIYMITSFIPIPGASGGSEATYVLLYSYVMGNVMASSSMLIWRFATYYLMMLAGGLTFSLNREINRRTGDELL